MEQRNDYKINYARLIGPGLIWAAGLALIITFAPRTVYINRMVGLGFLALCIGTFLTLYVLYLEYDKTGNEWPAFLDGFFPNYPVIEDKNETMRRLSGFRKSFSDYLSKDREEENSSLQDHATQLMWHSIALQKKRMLKLGLTMEMDSERRAYSGEGGFIREKKYFDGRYRVNDVYEEISAIRTFRKGGKIIGRIRDNEVAHFTLLSAKQIGANKIICPNCGNTTTRENLLDGCDYCSTKFTIEDLENRVDSFGLRRDFRTNVSKKEAVKEVMLPWADLILMLPLVYFGLIGAFVYMPGTNIFIRLFTGLLATGLFVLLGWCLRSMFLTMIAPILLLISNVSTSVNGKLIYSRKAEEEQERKMAERVRASDPYFSIQNFFGGIQNKLAAIHYAEFPAQINAFSENDMSSFIEKYRNVVDIDCQSMTMESYKTDKKLQTATVGVDLRLLELRGGRIKERNERLKMTMVKAAGCKTQAVCGVTVLKCGGCGASLSLMEGKTCQYCGRDLDLKRYDWVIAKYERSV